VVNFFRVIRNQAQLIGFRLHQSKCRMASEAYGKHWTSVCVISSANWVLGIWPFFRYVHA
jgi:hypothetical protein